MTMAGQDFEAYVRELLVGADLQFDQEVGVRGLQLDFLVRLSENQVIALEVKGSDQDPVWAADQVRQYELLTGIPVFLVLPDPPSGSTPREGERVVYALRLVEFLRDRARSGFGVALAQAQIVRRPTIFAAMPFEPAYDDILDVMVRAADSVGATLVRIDKSIFNDSTIKKINDGIEACKFVVAEVSTHNPNVLFELGLAKGRNKNRVHLTNTSRRDLPFDIRDHHAIKYELGRTTKVFDELVAHFKVEMP
jgi:hypothetical protein